MKTQTSALLMIAATMVFLPALSEAQTFRCDKGVVAGGDSKADVVQRCGQPQMQDTFCEPVAPTNQVDTTGKTVINVPQCENVDSWTYNPGSGRFITTMQFRRGKLTTITDGNRAN